jgi:hypothetical protein
MPANSATATNAYTCADEGRSVTDREVRARHDRADDQRGRGEEEHAVGRPVVFGERVLQRYEVDLGVHSRRGRQSGEREVGLQSVENQPRLSGEQECQHDVAR